MIDCCQNSVRGRYCKHYIRQYKLYGGYPVLLAPELAPT